MLFVELVCDACNLTLDEDLVGRRDSRSKRSDVSDGTCRIVRITLSACSFGLDGLALDEGTEDAVNRLMGNAAVLLIFLVFGGDGQGTVVLDTGEGAHVIYAVHLDSTSAV